MEDVAKIFDKKLNEPFVVFCDDLGECEVIFREHGLEMLEDSDTCGFNVFLEDLLSGQWEIAEDNCDVNVQEEDEIALKTGNGSVVFRPLSDDANSYDMFIYINDRIKMRKIGKITDGITHIGTKAIFIELDEDLLDKTVVENTTIYASSGADK